MAQNTASTAGKKEKRVKRSATSGMSRALVRRETTSAYLFLLPSLVFFVGFVVIPMFICLAYSFLDYGLGGVRGFAGLNNYIKLFQDPIFHRGFLNTLLIVVVAVPTVTAFSLWVSSAIYKMHAVPRSFFRCVFYLPVVTGSVAITEAAQVDGATKLQVFWKIIWPSIMPTTLYVLVITTINSFQCFALIQLLTRGGPSNSTMTIMYQVYDTAYRLQDFGYANALGVILAIIIAIFSAIQFKVAKTDN